MCERVFMCMCICSRSPKETALGGTIICAPPNLVASKNRIYHGICLVLRPIAISLLFRPPEFEENCEMQGGPSGVLG